MKNKLLGFMTFILATTGTFAQADTLPVPTVEAPPRESNWKLRGLFGVNGTQTSFVNWNAGGRNNLSVLGFFSGSANYAKNKWTWKNNAELALGGLMYLDKEGSSKGLQKTDDKIDIATNVGYKVTDKLSVSMVGGFRTQFLDGYNYPNDSVRVSTFMAPGYANFALGIDYQPKDYISVFFSPLATKMTFVNDSALASIGAFGVKDAIFNGQGDIISEGKRFRGEIGAYIKMTYQKEVFKNIHLKTRLELFSNYAHNPQNIDVNFDILWTFKVNSWLSASLNWTLIYDDDINIRDASGGYGPRTQFKSVLGLGLSYALQNYKDPK